MTADHTASPMSYTNGSTALWQAPTALMEALHFNEDDLHANRQGRLGEAQRDLLRSRVSALPVMGLLMASLPLTFVVMSLITLASAGELSHPSDPAAFGLVIAILVIAVVLGLTPLFLILRSWHTQRRALEEGVVLRVEGAVEIEVAGRRCLVTVTEGSGREITFVAPRSAETVFDGCDRYRLYYVTAFRRIVAAECVDR